MNKIKKIGASIIGFLITIQTKVLGIDLRVDPAYGVEEPIGAPMEESIPSLDKSLLKLIGIAIIPIVLIIGMAIYVKKNKKDEKTQK